MYLATRNTQRGVVAADGLGVRRLEQAVDLAVGIVEKLNLTNAELVGLLVLGLLSYLLNGLVRQLQIFVVIHKLGHGSSSFGCDAPTRRWSLALRIEENYTF
jgi:hypothetical protein